MKTTLRAEQIIYLLAILLSLAILVLAYISPADFMDTESVYKGF
jgi:hypothetical protein